MIVKCRARSGLRPFYFAVSAMLMTLAFLAFFAFLPVQAANIVASSADGIDAILVIDTSGSMNTADPERITLEAASLFMDMMETRSSRLGIVGFSGTLHSVMPLTPINEISVRDDVRRTISQFVYRGWTDIGLALRTAAEMLLDDPDPANSPMIILFTDGRIELPENWADNRNVEVSYEDAWWAVDAVEDFAAIYTIGLNHDGTLNFEFLQEIADRTNARSYIADDAAVLPQIFNEIFANHIRSSITEVATIEADGETYAEVPIPIPSAFVSEANIIMLSTQPIASVRLFDPSGREVPFDDENYTLTYANRYSMIKVLAPMVGDWLLHVRGLHEDRITVNLIYNYNVNVSWSVTQPGAENAHFFDPTLPIEVRAGFISPLPASQIQTLFNESHAELPVYDMEQNLLETFVMENMGTSFALDFLLDPAWQDIPGDIRINVSVTHPGFEQTTMMLPINFDPEKLAVLAVPAVPPESPPEPVQEAPEPEPVQEAPEPTPIEDVETMNVTVFIFIGTALALAIAALILHRVAARRIRQRVYTGHLEVRALLSDGNYTSLEAPDLNTFAGQMSLMEFISNSLGGLKADKITQSGIPIWDIHLAPGMVGTQPVIYLTKKSATCHITDGDGNAMFKKKIIWEDGQQLIFSIPGESPKLEITYRAYED
ncbi:MAG: VWA domain-containing protein [Defluviitaleaceae bacterium]|nr:VWA domain-containing protein [Defluviitaleaceae bacterium]